VWLAEFFPSTVTEAVLLSTQENRSDLAVTVHLVVA
jgi:hypothetical protein